MASCTYNPGVNSVNPYAVLEIYEQSQNIVANSTTLWYELKIYRPSAIQSNASKNYSIVIDGTTVKSGATTIGGSGTKTIASGTHTVVHGGDGSKRISFSFTLDFKLYWNGTYVGTGSSNGSAGLTTIARATVPSLQFSNVTLGEAIQIDLPRASASFTHSITWSLGALSENLGNNLTTSATLYTNTSWASQFPSSESAVGHITCTTFNGSTVIGEKTVPFTVRISSDAIPTINSVDISEATPGVYNKFSNYIQNKSTLAISINASGKLGSSIVSYSTAICGLKYSGGSFTSSIITDSGDVNVAVSVVDSRGLTATSIQKINVLPYHEPMVKKLYAERADINGLPDAIGTYALIHIGYQISSLNSKNDCSCKIEYKKTQDLYWSPIDTLYSYSFDGDKNGGEILDGANTYSIRVTVTDFFDSISATYDNIPSAYTIFNVNAAGTSMCFGGVSQRSNEKCFDFEEPVYFKKNIYANDINVSNNLSVTNNIGTNSLNVKTDLSVDRDLRINRDLYFGNRKYGESKVLWSGGAYMVASDTITLSEPISAQPNGVVLIFSAYTGGAVGDFNFSNFFVSKHTFISSSTKKGTWFTHTSDDGNMAKYLYMYDNKIVGYNNNNSTFQAGGVTVDNTMYVLRYVIGI